MVIWQPTKPPPSLRSLDTCEPVQGGTGLFVLGLAAVVAAILLSLTLLAWCAS
jgi:hypothetical protein